MNDDKVRRAYEEMCQIMEQLAPDEALKALLFLSSSVIYTTIDSETLHDFLEMWKNDITFAVEEIDAQTRAIGDVN